MTINTNDRMCKLTCRSFSCSKRHFRIKKDSNGKKSFFCSIDNIECLGYMCNYAECRERKLNDRGDCLRPLKKPQQAQGKQKIQVKYQTDYLTPYDLDDKFRKKLTKR